MDDVNYQNLVLELIESDEDYRPEKDLEVLRDLKDRGFGVVIISPEELKNANPDKVEDRLVELSWDIINDLSYDEGEED